MDRNEERPKYSTRPSHTTVTGRPKNEKTPTFNVQTALDIKKTAGKWYNSVSKHDSDIYHSIMVSLSLRHHDDECDFVPLVKLSRRNYCYNEIKMTPGR